VAATVDWAVSKGVKRIVRRGRPFDFAPHTRIRGKQATGLGYLSGHSAIATSLMVGMATLTGRKAPWAALAGTVGLARMYVGAHLPLDVVGGFGLGLAVDDVVRRYLHD
jgi:undecaprenyl-diphosphatase